MNSGKIVDPHSVEGEEIRRRQNVILYGSVCYSNGTATVRPVKQVLTRRRKEIKKGGEQKKSFTCISIGKALFQLTICSHMQLKYVSSIPKQILWDPPY